MNDMDNENDNKNINDNKMDMKLVELKENNLDIFLKMKRAHRFCCKIRNYNRELTVKCCFCGRLTLDSNLLEDDFDENIEEFQIIKYFRQFDEKLICEYGIDIQNMFSYKDFYILSLIITLILTSIFYLTSYNLKSIGNQHLALAFSQLVMYFIFHKFALHYLLSKNKKEFVENCNIENIKKAYQTVVLKKNKTYSSELINQYFKDELNYVPPNPDVISIIQNINNDNISNYSGNTGNSGNNSIGSIGNIRVTQNSYNVLIDSLSKKHNIIYFEYYPLLIESLKIQLDYFSIRNLCRLIENFNMSNYINNITNNPKMEIIEIERFPEQHLVKMCNVEEIYVINNNDNSYLVIISKIIFCFFSLIVLIMPTILLFILTMADINVCDSNNKQKFIFKITVSIINIVISSLFKVFISMFIEKYRIDNIYIENIIKSITNANTGTFTVILSMFAFPNFFCDGKQSTYFFVNENGCESYFTFLCIDELSFIMFFSLIASYFASIVFTWIFSLLLNVYYSSNERIETYIGSNSVRLVNLINLLKGPNFIIIDFYLRFRNLVLVSIIVINNNFFNGIICISILVIIRLFVIKFLLRNFVVKDCNKFENGFHYIDYHEAEIYFLFYLVQIISILLNANINPGYLDILRIIPYFFMIGVYNLDTVISSFSNMRNLPYINQF